MVILENKWHEDKKLVVEFHYADDERRKRGVHGEQTRPRTAHSQSSPRSGTRREHPAGALLVAGHPTFSIGRTGR